MQMVRGNAAIRDHLANKKVLHLFEQVEKGKVRYVGEASYLSHHFEERPDRDGRLRKAIVFDLVVAQPTTAESFSEPERQEPSRLWSMDLKKVRRLAQSKTALNVPASVRKQQVFIRSEAVRVYVLRRAKGVCENCGKTAPFKTKKRQPYLEPHHLTRLADGGPDSPDSVAAVCPNCHREIHYGLNGQTLNDQLQRKILALENPSSSPLVD
jgi:5-methylcytosine-specific restriction protein A